MISQPEIREDKDEEILFSKKLFERRRRPYIRRGFFDDDLMSVNDAYTLLNQKIDNLAQIVTTEVTKEGEKTRLHTQEELIKIKIEMAKIIQQKNVTILDCLKFNPAKNISLISLCGIFISLFSILTSAFAQVHFLNPFFAIVVLLASTSFFVMAKVKEKMENNK